MPFLESWVESDPDGSVITVSLLDDHVRLTKRALRERLEGDPAVLGSGVFESGTFGTTAMVKKGAGRAFTITNADQSTTRLADGQLTVNLDDNTLYHSRASGLTRMKVRAEDVISGAPPTFTSLTVTPGTSSLQAITGTTLGLTGTLTGGATISVTSASQSQFEVIKTGAGASTIRLFNDGTDAGLYDATNTRFVLRYTLASNAISSVASFTASSGTPGTGSVKMGAATGYGMVSFNDTLSTATGLGVFGRTNPGEALYFNVPTGYTHVHTVNGIAVSSLGTGGLTVMPGVGSQTLAILRTDEATTSQRAGIVLSATGGAASRSAVFILDPNGANGIGSDYAGWQANQDGTSSLFTNGVTFMSSSSGQVVTFAQGPIVSTGTTTLQALSGTTATLTGQLTLSSTGTSPLVLSGSPTEVKQIFLGSTSVLSIIGTQYSEGSAVWALNAYQPTASLDSWSQSHASFKSILAKLHYTSGFEIYQANAGKTTSGFAAYWGSPIFSVSPTGALTATTVTFTGRVTSATTANGVSFSATGMETFANTIYGAGLAGYGTTNDVTLFNRQGTPVVGLTANTVNVTMAGALALTAGITATSGTFSSSVEVANSAAYSWAGRAVMRSPADGILKVSNNAETDFTRLQFGGTTSSFPALKRDSASIRVVLANDGGDTGLLCGNFTASGTSALQGITGTTLALTGSLQVGGGATVTKWLTATATWDPADISTGAGANGSRVTTTVTVTGAAAGDLVLVENPYMADLNNLFFQGYVSAADTVTVMICNFNINTASNPTSRTFRVFVLKF